MGQSRYLERIDKNMSAELESIIVGMQNGYKQGVQGDIYHGLIVREIQYLFERKELIAGKVSVVLPIVFEDMNENMKKLKYPAEGRPQYIKTSLDTTVNLCFSLLDQDITENQVPYLKDQMKMLLMKMQPANIFFENKTERKKKQVFGWFTYKGFTIDEPIYTHMFVTNIDNKVFHGTFSCLFSEKELWKRAFTDIMFSVRDMTEEESDEDSESV